MRRKIGIALILVGLIGFLVSTSQRGGYETLEGQFKAAVSQHERAKKDFWETARWLFVGTGVIGIVLTILPGKKE